MSRLAGMILLMFGIMSFRAEAQMKDPAHWAYTVRKAGPGNYELRFELTLDKGWHIWSLQPGDDGFLIAPAFNFSPDSEAQLQGEVTESGTLISKEMEAAEGIVNYYSNKVTYIQLVKAKPGTIIKGSHTYQVCNDQMCLPPKDQDFSFTIK